MLRKSYLVVAALPVSLLVACATPDEASTESEIGHVNSKKVCADPAAGELACHSHIVVDDKGDAQSNATPVAGFGPTDLQSAYNVIDGALANSGVTVAIVDAYGYSNAEADLAVYRAQFGLPPCTTANGCFKKVNQNGVQGSYPRNNTGWEQETALDLDMVSAMCPSCKILLVQASSASMTNLGISVNTAVRLGAKVVSNSYGGNESSSDLSYDEQYFHHTGVAITVSSGDSGYGVEYPAASQYVTAVGGTSLKKDSTTARGWSETAWSGAGSGCSKYDPRPAGQSNAIDPDCQMRTVADVSAVADPNTGVAVYGPNSRGKSAWLVFGGTSVAAPLIGGVYGVAAGGDPNASFASAYGNTSSLNDVTSGSNGSCSGSYLCTAGAGYDGPTGLGTPSGLGAF